MPEPSRDRSILEHLLAHVPTDGGAGLTREGYQLPEPAPSVGGVRWAPGALNGMLGHHTLGEPRSRPHDVAGWVAMVRRAGSVWGGRRAHLDLLAHVSDVGAPDRSTREEVLARLHHDGADRAAARVGRRLAYHGREREAVAFGIALIALDTSSDDREKLLVLARHDDFTTTVIHTLLATSDDPEATLFAVARVAVGWGRIAAVEALPHPPRSDIQRWLVCRGHASIPYGYLLLDAAWNLRSLLERADPADEELHRSAIRVLHELITGFHDGLLPSGDIEEYEDAGWVLGKLLVWIATQPEDISFHQFLYETRNWLTTDDPDDPDRAPLAKAIRSEHPEVLRLLDELLGRTDWAALSTSVLSHPSHRDFFAAQQAADLYGIDTFPALLVKIDYDQDGSAFAIAARSAGSDRIEEVVHRALQHLGPDDYAAQAVVSQLGAFPGVGWPLISRVAGSRWRGYRIDALRSLARWDTASFPRGVVQRLEELLAQESDVEVGQQIRALLADET